MPMKVPVQTREATADDIDLLLELYASLSPDGNLCTQEHARASLAQLSQLRGSGVLLGEIDGKPQTSCTLIVVPNFTRGGRPYANVENVVTHPDHRGRGLGTAILEAACGRAWSHGCYKVTLTTGSSEPATLSFYESAGFQSSVTGFQKRR